MGQQQTVTVAINVISILTIAIVITRTVIYNKIQKRFLNNANKIADELENLKLELKELNENFRNYLKKQ